MRKKIKRIITIAAIVIALVGEILVGIGGLGRSSATAEDIVKPGHGPVAEIPASTIVKPGH